MKKSYKFLPSSYANTENFEYLSMFHPESYDFLYSTHFTKKKELFKLTANIINIQFNYSLNEYFATLHNGIKTCMQLNLRLMKPVLSFKQEYPLINSSLLKSRFKDIFCNNKHFIFTNPHYTKFRTIKLRSKPYKREYRIVGSPQFPRSFNKLNFFTLIQKANKISYASDVFLRYKNYKKDCLNLYYLGFKFKFNINLEAKEFFRETLKLKFLIRPRKFKERKYFLKRKQSLRNLKYSRFKFIRFQYYKYRAFRRLHYKKFYPYRCKLNHKKKLHVFLLKFFKRSKRRTKYHVKRKYNLVPNNVRKTHTFKYRIKKRKYERK